MHDTSLHWSWLNILTKRRYDLLKDHFGDLEKALVALDDTVLKELGCRAETVIRVQDRNKIFDAEWYRNELTKLGISFLTIEDPAYPAALKTIEDAPVFLYYKGSLDILHQPCIALVGTRGMSAYGKRVTEEIVTGLVNAHIVTVSGLAYGIDAEVAKQTIEKNGRTVGVLGHGLGMMYPKANAELAQGIVDAGGLLMSEFPLDIVPDKFTFPARNRIIAGLSIATVVLEAAEESGSLITAELALDYNREVFAVPGQIFDPQYRGCHALIAQGRAKLVCNTQDILIDCGIIAPEKATQTYTPENEQEAMVLRFLSTMPLHADDLLAQTRLDTGSVSATLTLLEMKGIVKSVGEGKWVRAS